MVVHYKIGKTYCNKQHPSIRYEYLGPHTAIWGHKFLITQHRKPERVGEMIIISRQAANYSIGTFLKPTGFDNDRATRFLLQTPPY